MLAPDKHLAVEEADFRLWAEGEVGENVEEALAARSAVNNRLVFSLVMFPVGDLALLAAAGGWAEG